LNGIYTSSIHSKGFDKGFGRLHKPQAIAKTIATQVMVTKKKLDLCNWQCKANKKNKLHKFLDQLPAHKYLEPSLLGELSEMLTPFCGILFNRKEQCKHFKKLQPTKLWFKWIKA